MQTLEAIFSFLFFFLFAVYALSQIDYTKPNYSVYQYQLANDVWRVLYLTKALSYYPLNRAALENRMTEINKKTGMNIYIEGIITTSGRGIPCSENKMTMEKIWLKYGQPDVVQFTVCIPSS